MYTHLEDNVPKGRHSLELALILNPSPPGRRTLRLDPPSPSGSKGLGDEGSKSRASSPTYVYTVAYQGGIKGVVQNFEPSFKMYIPQPYQGGIKESNAEF